MATLYDLAMQYLNQSLPKTFKYDRTPPIGTNPPTQPGFPGEPIKKLLPRPGGNEDGFSVYNPDPNRTRTSDQYSPFAYRQAAERSYIGAPGDYSYSSATEAQKMMDNYPDYYEGKQLTGIPGAIAAYAKNSLPGRIIGGVANFANDMLPVNQRAIYENELLGQGIMLDDIGRIVSDGGNINTAENIMAGYNANKVTAETFQKRRDMINAKMSDKVNPKTGKTFKQEKLDALDGAEAKMLGTAKTRADTVFDAKSLEKDPDYVSFDDQLTANNMINTEKEDDENFNPLDPLNLNTTTAPGFKNFYNPYERDNIVDVQRTKDAIEEARLRDLDAIDPNPGTVVDNSAPPNNNPNEDHDGDGVPNNVEAAGGSYDGGYQGAEGGFEYTGNFGDPYSDDNFMAGDNSKADPTGTGNFSDAVTGNDTSPGATGGEGGGGTGNNSKIVCTMMNQSYGFGSFRNKIWMKFHKDLSPEYQKGYHKIFLPLVRIAKTNKVVKKILEHIAVHSTIDMRQATRGKMHLLGRIYRKILLPLCYFVGKHG